MAMDRHAVIFATLHVSALNFAVAGCSSLASLHSSSMHPSSQAPPTISADANPARGCHDHFYSYHPPHVIRGIRRRGRVNNAGLT
jgi:hypothetical protein